MSYKDYLLRELTSMGVPVLNDCPYTGSANAKMLKALPSESRKWPGRNHPFIGKFLVDLYSPSKILDPMGGVGQMWMNSTPQQISVHDIEKDGLDARTTKYLAGPFDMIAFSPPYLGNKSSGATQHQKTIRESKYLHQCQEFGNNPNQIGRFRIPQKALYFNEIDMIYQNLSKQLTHNGRMVIVIRDRIINKAPANDINIHFQLLKKYLDIEGVHLRWLERPSGYTQWKVSKDPSLIWISEELIVVSKVKV